MTGVDTLTSALGNVLEAPSQSAVLSRLHRCSRAVDFQGYVLGAIPDQIPSVGMPSRDTSWSHNWNHVVQFQIIP